MGKIFMTPEEVIEELGIGREGSKDRSREAALREFAKRNKFPKPVPMGNGKHGYLIDDIKDWARKDGKRLLEQKRRNSSPKGAHLDTERERLAREQPDEYYGAEDQPKARTARTHLA